MQTSLKTISLLAFASIAGFASAQVYCSGFEHTPIGVAQVGPADPVDARRLPVHNLGSSGQDGVEIKLRTKWGGGASVETGSIPVGSTTRMRYKGWDGTIKGRCDVTTMSGGWGRLTCAYPGALEVRCEVQNSAGQVVGSGLFPAGGIVAYLEPICPDGSTPCWSSVHHVGPPPTYVEYATWELHCDSAVIFNGNSFEGCVVKIIPIFPVGSPPMDVASMVVTSTAPQIAVRDAHISNCSWGTTDPSTGAQRDAECSGTGNAQIADVCESADGCTPAARRLKVNNLGSSGQDGCTIDWGQRVRAARLGFHVWCTDAIAGLTGTQVTSAAMDKRGWNVKKNVKCRTMPSSGFAQTDFDFSELPGSLMTITATLGGSPSGGTSGDPGDQKFLLDMDWIASHPFSRQFIREQGMTIHLTDDPADAPIVYLLSNGMFQAVFADTITMSFTNPDMPESIASVTFTGNGLSGNQFEISDMEMTEFVPPCPGDFNADGAIDFFDYLDFVDAFSAGLAVADFNHDGTIDFFDYLDFVDAFSAGC